MPSRSVAVARPGGAGRSQTASTMEMEAPLRPLSSGTCVRIPPPPLDNGQCYCLLWIVPLPRNEGESTVPTLPWTIPNPPPAHGTAFVMASRFEVRSLKDVPRFFLRSMAAWRQVRTAPGAYGASLIARPLARVFYTLSAWEDRDALYAYARTEPHRSIMTSLGSVMRVSTFTFWETETNQLPITWDEARRRLEQQTRNDAAGGTAAA